MGVIVNLGPSSVFHPAVISAAVDSFRSAIEAEGGRIIAIADRGDRLEVDWLPADADPELEPIRAEFPRSQREILTPVLLSAANDAEEDEIAVQFDSEAIFAGARVAECKVPGWAIPTPIGVLKPCRIAGAGNCVTCPKLDAVEERTAAGTGQILAIAI